MKIGVPKEIKPQEHRIGLTPDSVKTLVSEGHEVLVENNGGFEAGFENDQYTNAGAKIVNKASDIFNDAEIIVKVKEPQKVEVDMIRENQIVYTYLHLAAAKELTEGLIKSKSINIAYETVTDDNGRLPLLAPMSAVAGRMSVQAGAHCLEKNQSECFGKRVFKACSRFYTEIYVVMFLRADYSIYSAYIWHAYRPGGKTWVFIGIVR